MLPNALAFEYQRDYGTASEDLDVADLINNPAANGCCSVHSLGLTKETLDFILRNSRPIADDGPDARLIAKNPE